MRFLIWLNQKIHFVSHSRISSDGLYDANIVSATFYEESAVVVPQHVIYIKLISAREFSQYGKK